NAGNSGQEEAVAPDSGTQILPETQSVSETAEAADAEGTDGEADASSPWQAEDFTYGMIEHTLSGCNYTREIQVQGTGILGLSDSGKEKIQVNKHLVLPGKAPSGETIVGVGPNAFAKMGIETITFPEDMMIPYDDTVTHTITRRGNFIIKSGAFSDNNLTAMDFPEGILFIDAAAFKNNRMTEVRFPHTLWMIGNQAFASNSLRQVQLPLPAIFSSRSTIWRLLTTRSVPSRCRIIRKRSLCTAFSRIPEWRRSRPRRRTKSKRKEPESFICIPTTTLCSSWIGFTIWEGRPPTRNPGYRS
ncbi:leucine-rich repeat protein, partial [Clostridiaceae bacterium 68-1-5]